LKYLLISFFITHLAFAGSCCTGGLSSSQVMLGDTISVFRMNYSDATVLADINANSQMLKRSKSQLEAIRTLNLSYTYRLSNLWQVGLALPVVSKTRMLDSRWQSRQGLGDLSVVAAYKLFPEYRRNILFTRGLLYSSLKFANAPSLFTTTSKDLLDTYGSGHELLSVGLMGMKRNSWGVMNMQAQLGVRSGKKFSSSRGIQNSKVTTKSSTDSLISITQSVPIMAINLDLGISRSYSTNKATSVFIGKSQASLAHTTSIGISYSHSDQYDLTLSYSDDFLVGPAMNHILSRSVALGIISKVNL
jgi:hypothetical protein